ncbi:hypothetical protein Taro_007473 [Colocasia esculenta]|uniref:Leucine-rich repeat-containing N-terminal plant-type domain-containing protein n=1 Tax=Colocasia esculenta TaxID=4460 RepID=A0A843TVG9_COLES|nr:hypothetical protein [Colocasia esculenta]
MRCCSSVKSKGICYREQGCRPAVNMPAFLFITFLAICCCCVCEGGRRCHDEERRALLEIKESINYPNGTALADWRDLAAGGDDCCLWSGITCNEHTGRVVDIILIESRTVEDTWYPNFTSLVQLRELEGLDLAWNKIGGTFPDGLCNLTRLKMLELAANSLGGPIPQCLCHMRSLTELGLSLNHFNGSIPSCLANLYNLEKLDLEVNEFEGSIPPSIFPNLTKLTTVRIGADGLNGFISTQTTSLESLSLTDASITGTLPLWVLCNSSLTYLELSGNMLYGKFHLPCRNASSYVETIEFSHNRVGGSLPSDVGFSFSGLSHFRMAGNELEGNIPLSLGQAPLRVLDLSGNHLTGELPHTLTTNQTTLQYLNLSYNQLDGEMLPRESYMPNLQVLYLQHNRFTGSIPPKMFNLTLLKALHLGHNDLTCSLSSHCLPRFPSMIALSLSKNRFEGPLPSHLCLMQQLHLLDLSGNKLSGKIPPCLNNISFWKSTFSVAFNNLSGVIPYSSQFSTFSEISYEGNPGLCGAPLGRSCSSQSPVVDEKEVEERESLLDNSVLFYSWLLVAFALGFWGFIATTVFCRRLKIKYYGAIDRVVVEYSPGVFNPSLLKALDVGDETYPLPLPVCLPSLPSVIALILKK